MSIKRILLNCICNGNFKNFRSLIFVKCMHTHWINLDLAETLRICKNLSIIHFNRNKRRLVINRDISTSLTTILFLQWETWGNCCIDASGAFIILKYYDVCGTWSICDPYHHIQLENKVFTIIYILYNAISLLLSNDATLMWNVIRIKWIL